MHLEICVDSLSSAAAAVEGGADRLEVCGPLVAGGTTPSVGLIQAVDEFVKDANHSVSYRVMLRSREGDFCFNEYEKSVMRKDCTFIQELRLSGSFDGMVVGAQLPNGALDWDFLESLPLTKFRANTLHRISDVLDPGVFDQPDTWTRLRRLKIDTILTSGGAENCCAGAANIEALAIKARHHGICVMPGAGLNAESVTVLLAQLSSGGFTKIDWIHASGGDKMQTVVQGNTLFTSWRETNKNRVHELRFAALNFGVPGIS
eukprot:Gregarina_sp_Pseudo_9__359@NODE_1231_length_1759_cov_256_300581_g1157_i0_p1_GENE_NODE_1231_length_1759_cov_256_300581_g1157_i0NODE_1231_length_1759_cov_256_300581_g1157_i0_p1_ORF_typecomplete_len261_score41_90CutC/PF03932_14/3_2e45_NODE_1231_length_1759_cov_256_300581_g1157_i048830